MRYLIGREGKEDGGSIDESLPQEDKLNAMTGRFDFYLRDKFAIVIGIRMWSSGMRKTLYSPCGMCVREPSLVKPNYFWARDDGSTYRKGASRKTFFPKLNIEATNVERKTGEKHQKVAQCNHQV